MAAMPDGTKNRGFARFEMAAILLTWALAFSLRGLHLIGNPMFVGVFFVILIPLAVTKAFLDFRRKSF